MFFEDFTDYLKNGREIRRKSWEPSLYLVVVPCICYNIVDFRNKKVIKSFNQISKEDFNADDWEFFDPNQGEIKSFYHLKPIDPKKFIWDLTHITEFLVRANSEKEAREIASKNALSSESNKLFYTNQLWLLSDFVSCKKISESGGSEVIIMNFSNS